MWGGVINCKSGLIPASAGLVTRVKTEQPPPPDEEGDVANVQLGDEAQAEYLEYASLSEAQALFDLDQEEVMLGENERSP